MAASTTHPTWQELAEFLASLPLLSRPPILAHFRTTLTADRKPDKTPVTEADRQAEQLLRAAIADRFADHAIIGEEFGGQARDGYCWVIDPIDGTRPFLAGKTSFGTLVGLCLDGQPIAGLIDLPASDESYIGIVGDRHQPLFSSGPGGQPLRASQTETLANARIATTSPHAFSEPGWQGWLALSSLCDNILYGGDCSNYALLASGHIDIVLEDSLASHDIMGLVPVLLASGACVSDWSGQPVSLTRHNGQLLCTANPALHQAVLAQMADRPTSPQQAG